MIHDSLRRVTERISRASEKAGRKPEDVGLVLVTKEVGLADIQTVYDLGVRDFGENRVQEWLEKRDQLPKDIRWHQIGYLQTNKVKFLMDSIHLIHSCDRVDLAKELEKQAEKRGVRADILIQVNTSGEDTKYGFRPDEVEGAVAEMVSFDRLTLSGLMTIGPNTDDENQIRSCFRSLKVLRDRLRERFPDVDWRYLSMGMSGDFEIAVEEGSNLLRIGSAVFGARASRHQNRMGSDSVK